MKLHVFSDLHFEMHASTAANFFGSEEWRGLAGRADLAILAGDIGSTHPRHVLKTLVEPLRTFGESYERYCRDVPRWLPRLTGRSKGI